MFAPRTSKFGNIKTAYKGRVFDSKREAGHAMVLESLRKAKDPKDRVKSIVYQHKIPVVVNNVKICVYVADFYVFFEDGHKEIHEVKGMKTPVYRLKKKLVEAIYGDPIIEY